MIRKTSFFTTALIAHLTLVALFVSCESAAQIPSSCGCAPDTLGYAAFMQTLNPNENATFQLHVHQSFAVAYGVIGSTTPAVIQDLIDNSPEVTTIVMYACPGSENDDANLQASQLVFDAGLHMYLPMNGFVASGATDMFVAGSTRIIEETPDGVGVHSWSDGTNDATAFPVGHINHQMYIDYYVAMGFTLAASEAFYYFTINAAPANGIHWMSESELDEHGIRTCKYSASHTYTASQESSILTADLSGASYQWINCDDQSPIGSATSQTYNPTENGSYAVIVSENGCMGTTACMDVTGMSVALNESNNQLKAFPNPTFGEVRLSAIVEHGGVYDRLGRRVLAVHGSTVDMSSLAAGFYQLRTQNGDVVKLVKR